MRREEESKRVTFSSVDSLAVRILASPSTSCVLSRSHPLVAREMHGVAAGGDVHT